MSNHHCNICNFKLKSDDKFAYYSGYEHFIKNFYLKNIPNNFSGIIMKRKDWYLCINCSIDYYEWEKLCSKDKLNKLFLRRINGRKYKQKISYINQHIFSEFENCSNCDIVLNVRKDENVSARLNYIDGLGSFCQACYNIF